MNETNPEKLTHADVCGNTPAQPQASPAYQTKAPSMPAQPVNKLKKIVSLDVFDLIAPLLTFVFSYVFFENLISFEFSFGLFVGYILIFALASAYIISKQKKFPLSAIFPGVIALLLAFNYALGGDNVNLVNFAALICVSGVYCVELTGSNKNSNGSYFYLLDLLKCQVLIPIMNFLVPVRSFFTAKVKPDKSRTKKASAIIIGFICAVPVLVVVVPLLLSDAAFESVLGASINKLSDLFGKLFDYESDVVYILFTFVPTAIFAPYIYSVMFSFRHGLAKSDNKDTTKKYAGLRVVSTNIICGFLGVICAVYVIYLLSQSAYFFSAFAGHLPGGMKITVTEYARQGFFEMTKIAGINFCLIAACVLFSKRESGKISAVVKWFSLFLCVFNMILVATSVSKILLYINQMGLTEKRIYVFVFDIVLIFVFLAIIARLFNEKFPYMRVILAAACVAVTLLGFINIDDVIAKYNTEMYLAGKLETVDVAAIEDTVYIPSKAKIESLLKLTKCTDEKIANQAENALYHAFYLMTDYITNNKLYDNIPHNCIANIVCDRYLKNNAEVFEKYNQDVDRGRKAFERFYEKY